MLDFDFSGGGESFTRLLGGIDEDEGKGLTKLVTGGKSSSLESSSESESLTPCRPPLVVTRRLDAVELIVGPDSTELEDRLVSEESEGNEAEGAA